MIDAVQNEASDLAKEAREMSRTRPCARSNAAGR